MKFSQAGSGFSGFLDYTRRNGAVDLNNDYALSEGKKEDEKKYNRYIDYMKRNKATALEGNLTGQKLLPTFTAEKLNITENDEKILRKKLDKAEKQNHLLWEGVVSFRTDLMTKQKVYDPKTGHVDQKKIKQALQASMPDFLKKNNLVGATWWGNIHLNTDHLHIHFGIVEDKKSKRPLTKDGEEKGILTEASMRQLRGKVFRELLIPDQKHSIDQLKEKQAMLRKKVKNEIGIDKHNFLNEELLVNAYQSLPDEKYRFKSNATKLKRTKHYLEEYIKNELSQDSAFQEWTRLLIKEQDRYGKIYGESKQSYATNQIKMLNDQLGNTLLKNLYEISPKDLRTTELDNANKTTLDQDRFAIELLKRQIRELNKITNPDKKKIGKLRYELGIRRGKFRKKNIRLQDNLILQKIKVLQTAIKEKEISDKDVLVTLKLQQFKELLQLHKFELKPNYQLNREKIRSKNKLQRKLIDPINIGINSRLLGETDQYSGAVDREVAAIEKTRMSKELLGEIYGLNTPQKITKNLQIGKSVWQIKRKIANNNKKIKEKPKLKQQLQHENGALFGNLKGLYNMFKGDQEIISKANRNELRQIENRHLGHVSSRSSYRPSQQALRSISNVSQAAMHNGVRALSKHEQLEEAEERDIEREERVK